MGARPTLRGVPQGRLPGMVAPALRRRAGSRGEGEMKMDRRALEDMIIVLGIIALVVMSLILNAEG